MKRTLVLSLVLLCVTACVQAQDARSEFMKNPALSGSNYVAYPGPKHRLTPAPRGYEPFYLSHYGRHGSRYLIDTHDYDRPYFTLLRADRQAHSPWPAGTRPGTADTTGGHGPQR